MSNCLRRGLALAAGLLALGVMINVGVAWAAVAWGSLRLLQGQSLRPASARPDAPESGWGAPEHLDWPWPVPANWPTLKNRGMSRSFGLFWAEGTDNGGFDWNAKTHIVSGLRAGWPWKSMEWVRWDICENGVTTWTSGPEGLMCPPSWGNLTGFGTINGRVPRRLPLSPIWPGFVGNTLLYGAVSAAVIFGPLCGFRTVRRSRRLRAGRCTFCGYPIQGAICPECGARGTQD